MGNPDSDGISQNKDNKENTIALPREALITTAVTFLSDKKIQSQDPQLLRKFLLKKGLTEEEASIAFERSGVTQNVFIKFYIELMLQQNLVAEFGRPVTHFAPPPLPPPPVPSVWHVAHNIITTITSIGGILYAIYWLWKTYISPYLFGRKPKKKPMETSIAELEAAMGSCVADVKTIRSSLETLADQKAAELTQGVVVSRIQEVKSEIHSLKALLLSRNQFPATPAPLGTGSLSIPAWQLSAETTAHTEQEAEEEGTGSNVTTNGSDSSLEIVKDPNN